MFIKTFHIALSGGKTVVPFYKALAKSKDPRFKQTEFYVVDERYVPITHKESNCGMIKKNLISKIQCKKFHFFDTKLSIEKSLKKYEKEIHGIVFDMTILGIGEDGHFASIFPQSKAIKTKLEVAHAQTNKFAIKDRLTMTPRIILKSKKILVLLKDKPKVIKELKHPKKTYFEFPAHLLKKHKNLKFLSL